MRFIYFPFLFYFIIYTRSIILYNITKFASKKYKEISGPGLSRCNITLPLSSLSIKRWTKQIKYLSIVEFGLIHFFRALFYTNNGWISFEVWASLPHLPPLVCVSDVLERENLLNDGNKMSHKLCSVYSRIPPFIFFSFPTQLSVNMVDGGNVQQFYIASCVICNKDLMDLLFKSRWF